jgi:hypothetical protein
MRKFADAVIGDAPSDTGLKKWREPPQLRDKIPDPSGPLASFQNRRPHQTARLGGVLDWRRGRRP